MRPARRLTGLEGVNPGMQPRWMQPRQMDAPPVDRQTRVITIPSRNFVSGGKNIEGLVLENLINGNGELPLR